MSIVYLVTGANRGIGLGLVKTLSLQPESIIFAGVRDPKTAIDLQELVKGNENIHIIELISNDLENNKRAVKVIEDKVGRVDVVIANAAICETGTILTSTSDEFTNSFNINVLGPIILFQSIHDLLLKSTLEKGPVFTIISTAAGQISAQLADVRVAPYAVSKVAVNMVVKRIQLEHPDIISLAIHPGAVRTDMSKTVFEKLGIIEEVITEHGMPFLDVETSAKGIISVINGAKKETSGAFLDYLGEVLPY